MVLCVILEDSSEVKLALEKLKSVNLKNFTHIYCYINDFKSIEEYDQYKSYFTDKDIYFFAKKLKYDLGQLLIWSSFDKVRLWIPFRSLHDYSERILDRYAFERKNMTFVDITEDEFHEVKLENIF